MATRGQSITRANISASTSETKVYDHDSGGNNGTYYYYVCAPCWRVQMKLSKNWGSWGRTNEFYADYWNGSSWVRAMTVSRSRSQTSSGETNDYMYHNWNGSSTSGDVPNADLWRIVFNPAELYHRYLYIVTGGIGAMNPTVYEGWKKKKIYSNGNLGAFIYRNGDAQSDDAARSYFRNSNNRGTQVLATYDTHCIYTDYYR